MSEQGVLGSWASCKFNHDRWQVDALIFLVNDHVCALYVLLLGHVEIKINVTSVLNLILQILYPTILLDHYSCTIM
jgi:hypothetical protein